MMNLESLSNEAIVQCTIYGEARGESLDGMAGVGWVIRNRADRPTWWGHDYQSVCLKPKQFSCFNEDDPNRQKIVEGYQTVKFRDSLWKLCRLIAFGVINDWIPDIVNGANHYCHVSLSPSWANNRKPVKVIGNHKFYLL